LQQLLANQFLTTGTGETFGRGVCGISKFQLKI